MKNYLTLIAFIAVINLSYGQDSGVKLGVYKWTKITPMQACDIDGNPLDPAFKIPNKIDQKFNFIARKGADTAIIQVINYEGTSPNYYLYNNTIKEEDYKRVKENKTESKRTLIQTQLYFMVPTSSISESAIPVFAKNWQFTVGALTMPVKMRIQKEFDFSGSFNISAAGGAKYRVSKYHENYMDLLVSIGLSSVNVDSFSRKNGNVNLLPAANLSALTIGTGVVFEFGKAQAGIMFGWDYLSSRDQKNYQWKYNGKPWFAIGFGLAIFGKQEEKEDPVKATQDKASDK